MARLIDGSVLLHRKLQEKGWDALTLGIFVQFLLEANERPTIKKKNGMPYKLGRGGLVIGIRDQAKKAGVAIGTFRKRVVLLTKDRTIKVTPCKEGTIIEIPNFEKYQQLINTTDTPRICIDPPKNSLSLKKKVSGEQGEGADPSDTKKPEVTEGFCECHGVRLESCPARTQPIASELVTVWNENHPDTCPAVRLEHLGEETLEHAAKAWASNPSREHWVKVIRRMAQSLWLTGQAPNRPFDTTTAFDFLVRPGKSNAILAGQYDPKPWGSKRAGIPLEVAKPAQGSQLAAKSTGSGRALTRDESARLDLTVQLLAARSVDHSDPLFQRAQGWLSNPGLATAAMRT